MKITEDTKIKDLIPEGYEIDSDATTYSTKCTSIIVPIKRCHKADFDSYIEAYQEKIRTSYIIYLDIDPNNWIFEYKIGLLKFICDDLKLSMNDMLTYIQIYFMDDIPHKYDAIYSIVPHEFLDSLT